MSDELLERRIRESLERAAPMQIPLTLEIRASAIPDTVALPRRLPFPLRGFQVRATSEIVRAAVLAACLLALVAVGLTYRTAQPAAQWDRIALNGIDGTVRRVVSGPGGLLAVGTSRNGVPTRYVRVWASKDGQSWTTVSIASSDVALGDTDLISAAAWGDGWVISVGATIWTSRDGTAWAGSTPGNVRVHAVAAQVTRIVAVGEAPPPGTGTWRPEVWTSTDGRTWSKAGISDRGTEFGSFWGVTFTSGGLVAWGNVYESEGLDVEEPPISAQARLGGAPWISTDGNRWHRIEDAEPFAAAQVSEIVRAPSGMIAVGPRWLSPAEPTETVWTARDGSSWTIVPEQPPFRAPAGMPLQFRGSDTRLAVFVSQADGRSGPLVPNVPFPRVDPSDSVVWTSSDAIAWRAFTARSFDNASVLDVAPWGAGLFALGNLADGTPAAWRIALP